MMLLNFPPDQAMSLAHQYLAATNTKLEKIFSLKSKISPPMVANPDNTLKKLLALKPIPFKLKRADKQGLEQIRSEK
jgi:hypothetical protein